MVDLCPHCGAVMLGDRLFRSEIWDRILRFVRSHPGASSNQIADFVYADYPDGGPLKAQNCIAVHISRMNRELIHKGLLIQGCTGPGGGYTLITVQRNVS